MEEGAIREDMRTRLTAQDVVQVHDYTRRTMINAVPSGSLISPFRLTRRA